MGYGRRVTGYGLRATGSKQDFSCLGILDADCADWTILRRLEDELGWMVFGVYDHRLPIPIVLEDVRRNREARRVAHALGVIHAYFKLVSHSL